MKDLTTAFKFLLALSLVTVAACGGGGGGGGSAAPPASSLEISGVASKGPLDGATIAFYSVDANGNKSTLLGSTITGSTGAYTKSLAGYNGIVIIEASGGSYTDEATGTPAIPLTTTLRAAVPVNTGIPAIAAITPLTEIAVRNLEKDNKRFLKADVDAANQVVGNIYLNGSDIVTTLPANPSSVGNALPAQRAYTQALTAISVLLDGNPGALATVIGNQSSSIDTTAGTLKQPTRAIITVGVGNLPSGVLISAAAFKVHLPPGVTPAVLNSDGTMVTSLKLLGGASTSIGLNAYSGNTISFGNLTLNAFGAGDIVAISCTIAPGTSVTGSQFSLSEQQAVAFDGTSLSGTTWPMSILFQ